MPASLRAEKRPLWEKVLALGRGCREIAGELERWHQVRPRGAHGWSLKEAAERIKAQYGWCRSRAASRGAYSRFPEGGTAAGEAEAALYAGCARLLAGYGYPISVLAIGDRTAAQVADVVAGLIEDRMTTRPKR